MARGMSAMLGIVEIASDGARKRCTASAPTMPRCARSSSSQAGNTHLGLARVFHALSRSASGQRQRLPVRLRRVSMGAQDMARESIVAPRSDRITRSRRR